MIVCDCRSITAAEICAHVDMGVVKYYDMQAKTGCGKTCGSCAPKIIDTIVWRLNAKRKNTPRVI